MAESDGDQEIDYAEIDRREAKAADARTASRREIEDRAKKRIAGALLDLLPTRDRLVMEWLCGALGQKPGDVAFSMIRTAIIRERPAYREAHGSGGQSSKDLEALTERLTPKT